MSYWSVVYCLSIFFFPIYQANKRSNFEPTQWTMKPTRLYFQELTSREVLGDPSPPPPVPNPTGKTCHCAFAEVCYQSISCHLRHVRVRFYLLLDFLFPCPSLLITPFSPSICSFLFTLAFLFPLKNLFHQLFMVFHA